MNSKPSYDQIFESLDKHLSGEGERANLEPIAGIQDLDKDIVSVLRLKDGNEFRTDMDFLGDRSPRQQVRSFENRLSESKQFAYDSLSGAYNGRRSDNGAPSGLFNILSWKSVPVRIGMSLVALFTIVSLYFNQTASHIDGVVVYSTRSGEIGRVMLADGSEVTLNTASRISLDNSYSVGTRDISLTGEAVFNVRSHEGSPFIVRTSNSSVKVLGTEFVVRNYSSDPTTKLSVFSGRVSMGERVASAGQSLTLTDSGAILLSSFEYGSDSSMISFRSGILQLNGVKVKDAVVSLERWYNTKIEFDNKKWLNLEISGDFKLGSTDELIEIFSSMLSAEASVSGNTITFIQR